MRYAIMLAALFAAATASGDVSAPVTDGVILFAGRFVDTRTGKVMRTDPLGGSARDGAGEPAARCPDPTLFPFAHADREMERTGLHAPAGTWLLQRTRRHALFSNWPDVKPRSVVIDLASGRVERDLPNAARAMVEDARGHLVGLVEYGERHHELCLRNEEGRLRWRVEVAALEGDSMAVLLDGER